MTLSKDSPKMTMLKEEWVIKATKAIDAALGSKYDGCFSPTDLCDDTSCDCKDACTVAARSALLSVIPDIVEACAKVADAKSEAYSEKQRLAFQACRETLGNTYHGSNCAAAEIAMALRSLVSEAKNDG